MSGGGGWSTAGSVTVDAIGTASIATLTVDAGGEVNIGATLNTARRGNVVVNAGGVKPSYLGPPESFHR